MSVAWLTRDMDHIIHEITGDGAGLSADDAQNGLAAMQPTGAVTSVLAPAPWKEASRVPMPRKLPATGWSLNSNDTISFDIGAAPIQ